MVIWSLILVAVFKHRDEDPTWLQRRLERLEQTVDGDSNLLDQSMIIWGSPMGDPNVHNHRRCPLVLLGGANGAHRGGSHVKAEDGTPMANAMLTVLNRIGHDMASFGDSTGELTIQS